MFKIILFSFKIFELSLIREKLRNFKYKYKDLIKIFSVKIYYEIILERSYKIISLEN